MCKGEIRLEAKEVHSGVSGTLRGGGGGHRLSDSRRGSILLYFPKIKLHEIEKNLVARDPPLPGTTRWLHQV